MKRSKNQAVYRYLPGMWISDKPEGGMAITGKINNWNERKMPKIYDKFIDGEIKRQVRLFGIKGGDISSFKLSQDKNSFTIVEPACVPGVPDIVGEKSPLVFYCNICGEALELKRPKDVDRFDWVCKTCKKKSMRQLQMVYSCECGYASPIFIPRRQGVNKYYYHTNDNQFKMVYYEGKNQKDAEFVHFCPTCKKRLVPDNAISNRNYKPMSLRIINLVDDNSGRFYDKGINAYKVLIALWLEKLSYEDFKKIIEKVDYVFDEQNSNEARRKKAEEQARGLIAIGLLSEADFDQAVSSFLSSGSQINSVEELANYCDQVFQKRKLTDEEKYNEWLNHVSFKLMQYNTLKYTKNSITMDECIKKQLDLDFIESESEMYDLLNKMGIANLQVSTDIEIVNCTYGFTGKTLDPKKNNNPNCLLKLNSYSKSKESDSYFAYGAKLNTEGILFEISQKKILLWLQKNGIVREEQLPDLEDSISIKKWFAENINSSIISNFGEIDESEKITKYVFELLHSMSHAFLKTAGDISGLSSNSLSEIIMVDTTSFFIYAQSSQGLPLGSLSGLAESNSANYLRKAFNDNKNCIYDPFCAEDSTACNACLVLPEISCNHFNAELGRKYLYTIKNNTSNLIGFWEM